MRLAVAARRIPARFRSDGAHGARRARCGAAGRRAFRGAVWGSNRVSGARKSAPTYIKSIMSDKASLSDVESGRHLGRFRCSTMVISAAVGYRSHDDSRRAHALRTAPRPRLGAPQRVVSRPFRGRRPVLRRRGALRARFRGEIRAAVGRRLSPPPRPESRRRRGAEPALRREDEAALRDAVALAKPGQDLGPAGRVYSAFRTLVDHGSAFGSGRLVVVAADLQSPISPEHAAELVAALREMVIGGRPAPVVAAAAATAVMGLRADAEPLALLCADAALAKSLGWPRPLPLLASELFARRATGEGRRPRPGEAGWGNFLALSYARAALGALDLAQDLARRAGRLADAAPKLRAKGKAGALEALLADDAVSAAAPIVGLSDRARRRLFDRLVALGAARELTGRPSFRLYGL